MKFHWSPLYIAGAIASAIPYASSHELHLPYLPSLVPENPVETYLSLKWAIQNGSLYANNDRVFPPAMSMQLHAPLYESHRNIPLEQEDIKMSYSITARPIPSGENGSRSEILRIHVELLDNEGRPVTPNAVALDLLDHPDGTHRITRVRLESTRAEVKPKPWQMTYWKSQVDSLFNQKDKPTLSSTTNSQSKPKPTLAKSKPGKEESKSKSESESESDSTDSVGYIFSPYFSPSTWIVPSEKGHHGKSHTHHHHHHKDDSFLRLIRPVILPAMLGIGAGLVACLFGFCAGHLIMAISARLGFCKKRTYHRRLRSIPPCLEEGYPAEKALFVIPEVQSEDSDE